VEVVGRTVTDVCGCEGFFYSRVHVPFVRQLKASAGEQLLKSNSRVATAILLAKFHISSIIRSHHGWMQKIRRAVEVSAQASWNIHRVFHRQDDTTVARIQPIPKFITEVMLKGIFLQGVEKYLVYPASPILRWCTHHRRKNGIQPWNTCKAFVDLVSCSQ
jgi:hypothetical protein